MLVFSELKALSLLLELRTMTVELASNTAVFVPNTAAFAPTDEKLAAKTAAVVTNTEVSAPNTSFFNYYRSSSHFDSDLGPRPQCSLAEGSISLEILLDFLAQSFPLLLAILSVEFLVHFL